MRVCLDNQIFYKHVTATDPKPGSGGLHVRERDPSAAISGSLLHLPLPQDIHDPQPKCSREPEADVILISSDDEPDNPDGRSDASFELLDGLLSDVCNKVKPSRVAGTGMCLDLAFLSRPTC